MPNKVCEMVTKVIVSKIEEAIKKGGLLPWQKPWTPENVPVNYITQKPYRGVNLLLLESGEYLTWIQLAELQNKNHALQLKKGSKAHMIVFFSFRDGEKETKNSNGQTAFEAVRIPFLRYYKVFNAADVEGLMPKRKPAAFEHTPVEMAENIVNNYVYREGVVITHKAGDKAYYNAASDVITLPEMRQFERLEEYYSTLFHELAHSTGNAARLDRLNASFFGDTKYRKEELIAEIGAAMLCGHCQLDTTNSIDNSASYLLSWLMALKEDATLIVCAAAKAQKAVDLILNKQAEQTEPTTSRNSY